MIDCFMGYSSLPESFPEIVKKFTVVSQTDHMGDASVIGQHADVPSYSFRGLLKINLKFLLNFHSEVISCIVSF